MESRMWIVYDSRALTDLDRASVYVACESEQEARDYVFDPKGGFDDGVCYSYKEVEGTLVDGKLEFIGPALAEAGEVKGE